MGGASDNDGANLDMPVSSRRRRKKSLVWEHFTVEAVGAGCTRACCKQCKQTFAYSTGSKLAGTSHLKRHLAMGICPKNRRQDKKQLTPYTPPSKNSGSGTDQPKKRFRVSNFSNILFDQESTRQDIARMIIVHEYPLHMVEHSAFNAFVQNLQPRFKPETVSTIEGDCLAIYQKEKETIMQLLGTMPGRISLTLDLWTSSQTVGHVCLAGHFIDNDWILHRRVLNFSVVSSHTGNALADAIRNCLSEWNMGNKLFSVSLDNSSANDNISTYLRENLSNKNTLVLNGQLIVVRCFTHVSNLIVQDVLEVIHGIVYKIRESIKYVTSKAHEEKFAEIVQQLKISSTKSLSLDVQMQWNTTYIMLLAALEYKQAFTYLETCDANYNEAPSMDEWSKVETLCKYLKVLYDAATVCAGVTYPTANMYFHEAWKVQLELTQASMNEDPFIGAVTKKMHEKFDKYWKDCSLVLAIAVVMDPRFKMKLVEFSYSKIYGENAGPYVKMVDDAVHDLYVEYVAQPLPLTPAYVEPGLENSLKDEELNDDGLLDFDMFMSEMSRIQQTKSELDQYLDEALLPRIQDFDILNWWKLNKLKYPTLSRMAREILAIPMSTVTPELIFSTKSRVLDNYCSSLQPETLEALLCAKDWLRYQQQKQELDLVGTSNAIVKVES